MFTRDQKVNGELAVLTLSALAKKGYSNTEPLDVYEVETESGKVYYIDSVDGVEEIGTLANLEATLEGLAFCDETSGLT